METFADSASASVKRRKAMHLLKMKHLNAPHLSKSLTVGFSVCFFNDIMLWNLRVFLQRDCMREYFWISNWNMLESKRSPPPPTEIAWHWGMSPRFEIQEIKKYRTSWLLWPRFLESRFKLYCFIKPLFFNHSNFKNTLKSISLLLAKFKLNTEHSFSSM